MALLIKRTKRTVKNLTDIDIYHYSYGKDSASINLNRFGTPDYYLEFTSTDDIQEFADKLMHLKSISFENRK